MPIEVNTNSGTRKLTRVRLDGESESPEFQPEIQRQSSPASVAVGIAGYVGALALGGAVLAGALLLM
ncbi:MAG: hypothetical protein AAF297_08885 [Planctomycetota bacterium]